MPNLRVVVVGCGGIGSWLIPGVARMLEYRKPDSMLMLVDGDTYEPKNKERQVFTAMGNKAEVTAADLQPLFDRTLIAPQAKWVVAQAQAGEEEFESKLPIHQLIFDGDVVFAVVDNDAARKIIFDYAATLANVDVFSGGNNDTLEYSTYHYQRRDGRDVTDHPAFWHQEYENPADRNPGELSCQERAMLEGGTQLIATNMAVAATLLGRFHRLLGGEDAVQASEIFGDLGLGRADAFHRDASEEPALATTSIGKEGNL